MQLLDIDYSNLDLKQIGTWPLMLRMAIVVGAMLLILICYYSFSAAQKLTLIQKNNQAMRDKYHEQLIREEDLRQLKSAISQAKLLDTDSKTTNCGSKVFNAAKLVEKINEIASDLLLNLVSLHLLESESYDTEYRMTTIELIIAANYHQIVELFSSLSVFAANFTIDQLTITEKQANVTIKVYAEIKESLTFCNHEPNVNYHGKELRNPFLQPSAGVVKLGNTTGVTVGNIKNGQRSCLIVRDHLGNLSMVAN